MPASLSPLELEFSRKQLRQQAAARSRNRHRGWLRRMADWREARIARYALAQAGMPTLVLDLSWDTGRFWPLLTEHPTRVVLAASGLPHLFSLAAASQPAAVAARVRTLLTSTFAIDLPDNAVESVFCMHLLQHVGEAGQRLALLREMHRVTRDTLIVSLWVDGNYQARRRARRQTKRAASARRPQRHVVAREHATAEFRSAGFSIVDWHDALPHYAMGRTYVLRKEPQP